MKKVLIYGLYDWNNLGDDIMMYAIRNKLQLNNIQPYFISGHHDNYFNEKYVYENKLQTDKISKNKLLNSFLKFWQVLTFNPTKEKYDSIIFMGGGYINRSIGSGYGKLIYIYILKKKFSKKNIFFTGQTVGPINNKIDNFLIKHIYKNAKVYVREKYSQDLLNSLNVKNKLCGDDAFLLNTDLINNNKTKKYFVVNFKIFFGYENLFDNFYEMILKVAKEKKLSIVLIPFRNKEQYEEYRIHLKLKEKLEKEKINVSVFEFRDVNKLLECISNSEFMIGTAYHFLTLGILLKKRIYTGYIGEYYKTKIEGVIKLNNYDDAICYDLTNAKFIEMTNNILNFKNKINLKNSVNSIVKNVNIEWNNIIDNINGEKNEKWTK